MTVTQQLATRIMDVLSCAPAPFLPSGTEPVIPWDRWANIFDNYLRAVGGTECSAARRKAILLTCLGAEGQRVFETLPPADKQESEDDFTFAKRRLKTYFSPRTNVCAERYKFRSRTQQPGETVACWVTVLRQLATTCAYDDRTEEFLRDQVVERTSSSRLRQRLLMEGSDLTLTTTLTIAATLESAEKESRVMESPASAAPSAAVGPVPIQAVHQGGRARQKKPWSQQQRQLVQPQRQRRQLPQNPAQQQPSGNVTCWGCGIVGHRRGDRSCPAYNVRCHKCHQMHHFAKHCGERKVVSHVQVMTVGASPLTVEAQVEGGM